ncbi:MAG: DUF3570 domain-containing protein [bacterium]|nr:DUF3570 domain-containing protein [bacterium]
MGVYVRFDTDSTMVVSPRVHFRKGLGSDKTNLDLVYAADVWTSASIDVRTAATDPVTEQRDEINVGLDHTIDITRVGAGYRFSRENDYVSQAVSASLQVDAFQRNSTFDVRGFASFDFVGRAGDEFFSERQNGFGLWAAYTQVLSAIAWMQLAVESRQMFGYMASPYRFVSIGTPTCGQQSAFCVPEVVPRRRFRQAAVLRFRVATGKRASLGFAYRYYIDTWRLQGHTALANLAMMAAKHLTFKLEYRGYYQTDAEFYQATYDSIEDGGFFSRDRELSNGSNHRATTSLSFRRELGASGVELELGALLSGTHYRYPNFVGLDRVLALEASTTLGVAY